MNTTEHNELPDFEDLDRLITDIRDLTLNIEYLDIHIKTKEAEIIMDYTTDSSKFVNGKAISMTQLKSTVAYTGETNELVADRKELGRLTAELEAARFRFNLEKAKIDVWRTRSANERLALS